MKLISNSTTRFQRFKAGRTFNVLLCLTLLLFIRADLYGQQASSGCARKANTLRDTDLMDLPPTYSTKRGWVYGNKIGTIPRGTQILICEEQTVGFFGSKQVWFGVKWETKDGWINSSSVEEKKERQSGLIGGLGAFLLPTAFAQTDSKDNKTEDNKLTDPVFIGSFISIVVGMVAKILFDLFRKRRRWLGAKAFAVRLLPSLALSPIVFLGFLRTADIRFSGDLSILVFFLFAFQNGFFWEDILNMEQTAKTRPLAKKPLRPAGSD